MSIDKAILVDEVSANDDEENEAGVGAVIDAAASSASIYISVGTGQARAQWTGR
jgi:hypothetical protein